MLCGRRLIRSISWSGILTPASYCLASNSALTRSPVWVRVAPITVASVFSGPLDGVLGADSLNSFDIDLDLPNNRITFYSRQTCPGAAPAWTEPYITMAAGRSKGDHLFFPVQLDGHTLGLQVQIRY